MNWGNIFLDWILRLLCIKRKSILNDIHDLCNSFTSFRNKILVHFVIINDFDSFSKSLSSFFSWINVPVILNFSIKVLNIRSLNENRCCLCNNIGSFGAKFLTHIYQCTFWIWMKLSCEDNQLSFEILWINVRRLSHF